MSSNKTSLVLLFVVLLIFLNGCPSPSYSPHPTISSLWYDDISNELYVIKDNHILVFNNISTANGHISPVRIISPPAIYTQRVYGGLSNMWLDRASNQLFVTSPYTNSILVFTDTSSMNGNVVPARVISGTTTELDTPAGLWLDPNSNQLYVRNSNGILVFTDASTMNGNASPARSIIPTTNGFYPIPFWLDSASDQLYLTSVDLKGRISILAFTDVGTMNGNVVPARVISGTTTELVTPPTGLWLDSISDQLYVECGQDGILVFTDATTANGNVAPARSIIPTTNGFYPIPFWLDSASDQLYLTSVDLKGRISILAFTDASTINGVVTPSRVLYP